MIVDVPFSKMNGLGNFLSVWVQYVGLMMRIRFILMGKLYAKQPLLVWVLQGLSVGSILILIIKKWYLHLGYKTNGRS